ncbi:hypothetical protein DFJ58DRAFT_656478 [Suillus subalutaceus]|uniref:uncharacterized protein n=1 Tax=Suillus subalutaceus TaxID=48586 RepID=UPI001B87C424|nr:uncharacterized protein DFJ58DRAFT_656478 [Suillus subalutaceus]KAG1863284.1 hypothetical protein DFJ58DRAFT_656478 [Suillus subalutaceus]
MAFEDGTPLYHRDVEKLDRQDDNAAASLFSSATLEFLIDHHPDDVGEIVCLFVHGEIVDTYQNRAIPHRERIKMVLRARYFYDGWRTYLERVVYKETQYFMSRKSIDITARLIDGLVGLIVVYRDHISGDHPLLPWLHTSEPCEHCFANLRKIVKDFMMLDAYYTVTKLHAKLQQEVLRQQSPDFKARAQGYTITYFYDRGVNIPELSKYPDDVDIYEASLEAATSRNVYWCCVVLVRHSSPKLSRPCCQESSISTPSWGLTRIRGWISTLAVTRMEMWMKGMRQKNSRHLSG